MKLKPSTSPQFSVLLAIASEAGAPEWTLVMPYGELRAKDGRRWTNPQANASKVIQASLAIAGSTDMPFDYDHQLDLSAVPKVGGTAPASGWIKELEARDDGIYARVEWTARASAAIDAREYRYVSPVFDFDKTGLVVALRRAALTNRPALDLPALASEHTQGEGMDYSKIAQALGLGADATEDQILAALAKLTSATAAASELAKVRTGLKLGADADGEAILTAIAAQSVGGDATEAVVALQTRLNTVETALASDRASAKVDGMIKAGKIAPAARTVYLAIASETPARFDELMKDAPVILKPGTALASDENRLAADGTYTLNAIETALCAEMGWDTAAYAAERKKELA